MNSNEITISSLGRIATFGDLYDARSDVFRDSVFRNKIPESAITRTDDPFNKTEYILTDKVSDKFKTLNVNGELQLSVICKLATLSGSACYLDDHKTSARSVKISLIYNVKTKFEKLNFRHDDLKTVYDFDALKNSNVTHIVTGISWGANCIFQCLYENQENKDIKNISGEMSGALSKVKFAIEGKADVGYKSGNTRKENKFEINLHTDVYREGQKLPTNIEEAIKFAEKIPEMITKFNSAKGRQLAYTLTPIKTLQTKFQLEVQVSASLQMLTEVSLFRVVDFAEQITSVKQQLNDFYNDVNKFKFCAQQKQIEEITNFKRELEGFEASFRAKLLKVLPEIRSGKDDACNLEKILADFQQQDQSPKNVFSKLNSWSEISKKIDFARRLGNSRAKYIGVGNSLDGETLLGDSVVLYFCPDARSSDPGRWLANLEIFFTKMEEPNSNSAFYAVDCEFHDSPFMQERKSCVQILKNGRVVTEDELEAQERFNNTPWAKIDSTAERILYKPVKRAAFQIPCTGNACNSTEVYYWKCTRCLEGFEYGFDSHVYCACGKTKPLSLTFKCIDTKHGKNFERHNNEKFLLEYITTLRPFKELNILILGETGVGKSTWINSFLNYLSYSTLDEAYKNELLTVIPSKFTVTDDNYETVDVVIGNDQNECFDAGMSGTQQAKVYQFDIGNTKLRLIDSPGIGDVRGIDKDHQNFQNILGTISHLDELHGVCILLKPNSSKLNNMFRFCVVELLTHLHKDVCKNIVFCFTHTSPSYKPTTSLPTLQTLLKDYKEPKIHKDKKKLPSEHEETKIQIALCKDTMYCFDSEPYRYLATSKYHPTYQFTEEEIESCKRSWNKSMSETERMLKHIGGLKPHKINNTVSLNYARQSILSLTKPLFEINQDIFTNKSIVEEELEAAKKASMSKENLEKQRWVERTKLNFVKLENSRTVCSNSECCISVTYNDNVRTEYNKYCHNPCTLTEIPADTIGHAELLRCWAMTVDTCRICGHSYREHLHNYYEVEHEKVLVEDQDIVALLSQNLEEEDNRKKVIDSKNKLIEKYMFELQTIQKASINFTCYLKQNATVLYNDAMEEYIEYQKKNEQAKVNLGGSRKTLEHLEKLKKSYIELRSILQQSMEGDNAEVDTPGPDDVDKLIKELQDLPIYGSKIQEALNFIKHTSKVVYQETVVNDKSKLGMFEKAKKFFGELYSKFV